MSPPRLLCHAAQNPTQPSDAIKTSATPPRDYLPIKAAAAALPCKRAAGTDEFNGDFACGSHLNALMQSADEAHTLEGALPECVCVAFVFALVDLCLKMQQRD